MSYTFKTQSLSEYVIARVALGYTIIYNGLYIGKAHTLTGAHCVIVSKMIGGLK